MTSTLQKIADETIKYEGGGAAPYSAINADGEYEGLFDRPKKDAKGDSIPPSQRTQRHSASKYNKDGGWHVGLSYGAWQFTQDGGALGKVLSRFAKKNRAAFDAAFGGPVLAQQLLNLTGSGGDSSQHLPGGRSARVQPLDGADLWREPWATRFREAGKHPDMRAAQQDQALYGYMRPALDTMRTRGWTKPSTAAVLFDIAIQYGKSGMQGRVKAVTDTDESTAITKVINNLDESKRARRNNIRNAVKQFDGTNILSESVSIGAAPDLTTGPPPPPSATSGGSVGSASGSGGTGGGASDGGGLSSLFSSLSAVGDKIVNATKEAFSGVDTSTWVAGTGTPLLVSSDEAAPPIDFLSAEDAAIAADNNSRTAWLIIGGLCLVFLVWRLS